MKEKLHKRIFNLQEVGFNDLDGNFTSVVFDQKDFGNALYKAAETIELEDFARGIHKDGKAELTDGLEAEIIHIIQPLYKRRAVIAVQETIEKLK